VSAGHKTVCSSGFVGELCLALAHRWEPERLFMFVYTGYLDESGTHDGSPLTVMGGVLARAEQWRDFEKKFAAVQSRYGFKVWHTKKFKKKAGDFKGWTNEKCESLYWDMGRISGSGLTDIVALTLDNASYEVDYKAGDLPRRARLDTKYGLCFRFCLVHFMREVLKRRRGNKVPPLHIVLEAGHANFGDAERIFLEEKRLWTPTGVPILRTLTKADKDDCGGLMLADFAAHSEYLIEKKQIATGVPRNRCTAVVPKGMTPSTHIQFTPGMLRDLRASIVERATPKKGPNAPSRDSEEQPS
jgi:hypothetical protein